MEVKRLENGMNIFKVRYDDRCKKCGRRLSIMGIAEGKDRHYKVIVYCESCSAIYEFERVDRRTVEERATLTSM